MHIELTITQKCEDLTQPADLFLNTSLIISIDDSEIFTINGINFHKIINHPIVYAERCDVESFLIPFNKTWGISIDLFKAVFPYEHNFAEAVQNQFVSVFKWLKIIHNVKKDRSLDRPLPSDLLINVRKVLNS
ncbi:hypothetical protein NQ314_020309 [Rhamnusium bicolor]|uniref:Uncharacterized protein n=1 Tax=Rhamnusium bicolor TaxID=1586634 RepID=A0AAV8WLP1_9CUCU|nr:hypothetical protein NQ314_020309 [Rhamnusium bicolor]